MAEVKLVNVNKSFGDVQAVRTMNLTVADEEFLVLVGPSGCGKTTTLRMIAGLETADTGDIFIGEKRVNELASRKRDVAVVFQNYALYPHMSIYDNMAYGLKRRKFPKAEIRQRVEEAAEILGITPLLQRNPAQLSGGQQQRVALGRAIVRQPAAFLFDEPLSALDAKLRVQMRAELSKLHENLQSTMIYVTHDQVEAMTMGDRIVVMNDGLVQQVGTPEEVYHRPANLFVAGFVGSPPMNIISGRLARTDAGPAFVSEGMELPLLPEQVERVGDHLEQPITLGIRAEDMHVEDVPGSREFPELEMEVEVVEPLGFETHAYMTTGHEALIVRVSPRVKPEVGDRFQVKVDVRQMHLFDVDDGRNLLV